ncbi:MAG: lipid-binding SYLF domain-containing protein [Planctomycetota bacterium]|jgi:lipid-binding SYLF domain-containing protein
MMRLYRLCLVMAGLAVAGGCATPKGETIDDKRAHVRVMRDQALTQLYAQRPGMEARIKEAPGYGVFSNFGMGLLLLGTANGYGVVYDKAVADETFMKMFSVGVGLGVRLEDFRAVFVFNDADALRKFKRSGWEFGAGGQAALKAGDKGGAATGQASFNPIDIYTITESGIALRGAIDGTKYSRYNELN